MECIHGRLSPDTFGRTATGGFTGKRAGGLVRLGYVMYCLGLDGFTGGPLGSSGTGVGMRGTNPGKDVRSESRGGGAGDDDGRRNRGRHLAPP